MPKLGVKHRPKVAQATEVKNAVMTITNVMANCLLAVGDDAQVTDGVGRFDNDGTVDEAHVELVKVDEQQKRLTR